MKALFYIVFIGVSLDLSAGDAMYQCELRVDKNDIGFNDVVTVSMIVRNISTTEQRLDALHFVQKAGHLNFFYYSGNDQELIAIPFGIYRAISYKLPGDPWIILGPSEEVEFFTDFIYKYHESSDMTTLTYYKGNAFVFEMDAHFVPIQFGVKKIIVSAFFIDRASGNRFISNEIILNLKDRN